MARSMDMLGNSGGGECGIAVMHIMAFLPGDAARSKSLASTSKPRKEADWAKEVRAGAGIGWKFIGRMKSARVASDMPG
jgi:hypothetical protein